MFYITHHNFIYPILPFQCFTFLIIVFFSFFFYYFTFFFLLLFSTDDILLSTTMKSIKKNKLKSTLTEAYFLAIPLESHRKILHNFYFRFSFIFWGFFFSFFSKVIRKSAKKFSILFLSSQETNKYFVATLNRE